MSVNPTAMSFVRAGVLAPIRVRFYALYPCAKVETGTHSQLTLKWQKIGIFGVECIRPTQQGLHLAISPPK